MAVCGRCWICGRKFECADGIRCPGCKGIDDTLVVAQPVLVPIDTPPTPLSRICRGCVTDIESGTVGALVDALRTAKAK